MRNKRPKPKKRSKGLVLKLRLSEAALSNLLRQITLYVLKFALCVLGLLGGVSGINWLIHQNLGTMPTPALPSTEEVKPQYQKK
jgi:hypothetical protein